MPGNRKDCNDCDDERIDDAVKQSHPKTVQDNNIIIIYIMLLCNICNSDSQSSYSCKCWRNDDFSTGTKKLFLILLNDASVRCIFDLFKRVSRLLSKYESANF